jgi:hypothetical protein
MFLLTLQKFHNCLRLPIDIFVTTNRIKKAHVLSPKYWLMCAALCLHSLALAQWSYLSSADGDTVLLDRNSLVQNKNRNSTIWMLTNYGSPTAQNVLSVAKWIEFDCDRSKYRYLAVYGYEGQMQTGARLIDMRKVTQWDKVNYGTVIKNIQLIACLRGPLLR